LVPLTKFHHNLITSIVRDADVSEDADRLHCAQATLINFSWQGGDGDLEISDIVVWIRVNA
jgi:hypothetical protein